MAITAMLAFASPVAEAHGGHAHSPATIAAKQAAVPSATPAAALPETEAQQAGEAIASADSSAMAWTGEAELRSSTLEARDVGAGCDGNGCCASGPCPNCHAFVLSFPPEPAQAMLISLVSPANAAPSVQNEGNRLRRPPKS